MKTQVKLETLSPDETKGVVLRDDMVVFEVTAKRHETIVLIQTFLQSSPSLPFNPDQVMKALSGIIRGKDPDGLFGTIEVS